MPDEPVTISIPETHDRAELPAGCRYGRHASDCAYVLALVLASNTESVMGEELLDYCMGLVVNSHDDVESLLTDYARTVGWHFTGDDVGPIDTATT